MSVMPQHHKQIHQAEKQKQSRRNLQHHLVSLVRVTLDLGKGLLFTHSGPVAVEEEEEEVF